LWQRKFEYPITHSAFVLMKTSEYEFLSSVKVEDAALEYLGMFLPPSSLFPFFAMHDFLF